MYNGGRIFYWKIRHFVVENGTFSDGKSRIFYWKTSVGVFMGAFVRFNREYGSETLVYYPSYEPSKEPVI